MGPRRPMSLGGSNSSRQLRLLSVGQARSEQWKRTCFLVIDELFDVRHHAIDQLGKIRRANRPAVDERQEPLDASVRMAPRTPAFPAATQTRPEKGQRGRFGVCMPRDLLSHLDQPALRVRGIDRASELVKGPL